MKLENIKQPPFNTSLMGVIRGVIDYYNLDISDGKAYGGSGHAFLINIHEVVCPSGPYCWKYDGFYRLLHNLGLQVIDLGFFHKDSKMVERKRAEDILRQHLDAKRICSTQNMDNQIIYGYDDKGFLLTQPWGAKCDTTPAGLSFGSWDEYGDELHAIFLVYQKIQPADNETVIRDSLHYALDLFKNPPKYAFEKYTIGAGGYDVWMKALEQGKAHAHGTWWNAMVWSECRKMASDYFKEIAKEYPADAAKIAEELATQYEQISDRLREVSDKEMDAAKKIPLLEQAKAKDLEAIQKIEQFLDIFVKISNS